MRIVLPIVLTGVIVALGLLVYRSEDASAAQPRPETPASAQAPRLGAAAPAGGNKQAEEQARREVPSSNLDDSFACMDELAAADRITRAAIATQAAAEKLAAARRTLAANQPEAVRARLQANIINARLERFRRYFELAKLKESTAADVYSVLRDEAARGWDLTLSTKGNIDEAIAQRRRLNADTLERLGGILTEQELTFIEAYRLSLPMRRIANDVAAEGIMNGVSFTPEQVDTLAAELYVARVWCIGSKPTTLAPEHYDQAVHHNNKALKALQTTMSPAHLGVISTVLSARIRRGP